MKKIKQLILLATIVLLPNANQAQEIHALPFAYNTVTIQDIESAFDHLHIFSESIYQHAKLKSYRK